VLGHSLLVVRAIRVKIWLVEFLNPLATCDNSDGTRLLVEGRLAGACVHELEKCWRETASTKSPESILVDLSSVTFVDTAGKQLLARMHERGTRFTAAGLLANDLIEEIESSGVEKDKTCS
jgi:hypothetical protein